MSSRLALIAGLLAALCSAPGCFLPMLVEREIHRGRTEQAARKNGAPPAPKEQAKPVRKTRYVRIKTRLDRGFERLPERRQPNARRPRYTPPPAPKPKLADIPDYLKPKKKQKK